MKYSIDQLRQVKGIGAKTIERILEQFDESEYISKYNEEIHIEPNSLVQGDMLEVMNGIPDKSVDMILTDLPYGTTANKWDSVIPLDKLWKQYNRVIKDDGAIVLFAQTPFDKVLGNSNIDSLRYEWIWEKEQGTGFFMAKKAPLKNHENLLVFYKKPPMYEPQMRLGFKPYTTKKGHHGDSYGEQDKKEVVTISDGERYPLSVLSYSRDKDKLHPTQKPLGLIEYVIKTYTKEGQVVLDSTMGSGTTPLGAKNLNRKYIGIELDEEYFEIAKERVEQSE